MYIALRSDKLGQGGVVSAPGKLVEGRIPIREVSRDAGIEMSFKPTPAYVARCRELGLECGREFYDPKIRSLHPWLARRSRAVARALNLAALLPQSVSAEEFLRYLGFRPEALTEAVSRGFPPLLSYLRPSAPVPSEACVVDPMAGGGTIPLEAAILGARTVACDYNPVAYLILRATVEFPARYGLELWRRLVGEARRLIDYAAEALSPYYDPEDEGYIVLRRVRLGSRVEPLQRAIPLSDRETAEVSGEGDVRVVSGGRAGAAVRRELLGAWMRQHREAMEGDGELYRVAHFLAVVQRGRGLRPAGERDIELALRAYSDYLARRGSLLLPRVPIPRDNGVFSEVAPLERYDMLFSPRQALALGTVASYVRDRVAELVEEEGEFGAAVGLYLALGVDRLADFNSIATTWNHRTLTVRDSAGAYYKFRKLRLEGVYAEAAVPNRTLGWVFEPDAVSGRTAGGICPVVRDLAERLEGRGDRVSVYMCDATELSKSFGAIADVINVDPPYYDQHVYSDFSEFFWPLLRTVLEPALPMLFGGRVLVDWDPASWRVPRSREVVARRGGPAFETLLARALREMGGVLKDDGVLVLWFSHRSPEAWRAVVDALRGAGFAVTAVIPFPSEHPTRSVTSGGKVGINRVLAIVARKREALGERRPEEIVERFREYLREAKLFPGEEVPEEEARLLEAAVRLLVQQNVRSA